MEYHKSVLVKNATADCKVILYLYSRLDPICWLSSSSKILQPGELHLHRSKTEYKFEVKTLCNGQKNTVINLQEWSRDTHFCVNTREHVTTNDLEHYPSEKAICIRKLNVEKEASIGNGRNLYEILKLNYEEIRKLDKYEQDREIKNAFYREIRRWHSDVAGDLADDNMAHEVIVAYDVLRDREKRADYHNMADYSKGWLSIAKYRSIFYSEWETEEQKTKYRKRLGMMAFSLGVGVGGGLILSILTAGAASPAVVAIGGILGAGLFGGGIQSGLRTISQSSIENGCSLSDYAKSFGLGFAGGVVTGGAAVGITAGITGVGSAAIEAASSTIGQHIAIGASSAAVGGAAFSLASDFDSIVVDGANLTWKQVLGHAVVGGVIGGVTGTTVGAVSGAFLNVSAEVSSATAIEDRLVPGIRRLGASLAKNISKSVTEKSTESVLGSVADFIEERIDDDQENRAVNKHLTEAGIRIVSEVALNAGAKLASAAASHITNEIDVRKVMKKDGIDHSNQELRQSARCKLDRQSQHQWNEINTRTTYKSLLSTKSTVDDMTNDVNHNVILNMETCRNSFARIKYNARGDWISKMVVRYEMNNQQYTEEVISRCGDIISIPAESKNVKVHFQAMRFILVWGDVKKWDRFGQKWHDGLHIFTYEDAPEQRTFTLDGTLHYEKVSNVTDERHDDVCDI